MRVTAGWFAPTVASAIASAFLCFLWRHQLSSLSVDVAWHYTLVDYYSHRWVSANGFSAVHPTMNGYPPVSHFLGAGISAILDSPFTGMRFAGILFVCVTYGFVLEGARSKDARTTVLSFCIVLAWVYLLRRTQLTYGSEILGNYFYAQACGHAVTLALLFFLSRLERSWIEAILVPVFIAFLGWLYALAQIQVLSGVLFLWCWAICRKWLLSERIPFTLLFSALSLLILGAAAIRFHPTYELMRTIANNEGGAGSNILSLPALASMACVLAGLCAAVVLLADRGKLNLAHPLFLATVGAGAAIAFTAHYSAFLLFHSGSAYGVRKHTFSLVSLLLVICSILIAQLVAARFQWKNGLTQKKFFPVAAVSIATGASVWILVGWGMVNVQGFEKFQREVRLQVEHFPEMVARTVSRLSDLSVAQNFAVTMVDLRVPDVLAIKYNLTGIESADAIQFEIVDRGSVLDQGCIVRELSTAIVVKVKCGP